MLQNLNRIQKHPPQPHRRMIIHSRKCLMMLVRGKCSRKKKEQKKCKKWNGYVEFIPHKLCVLCVL